MINSVTYINHYTAIKTSASSNIENVEEKAKDSAEITEQSNDTATKPETTENTNKANAIQAQESSNSTELTDEEEDTVRKMKQRDTEVRSHEQAHKTVGGPYAGEIQLETETGPDGQEYAVAGEVAIDASPIQGNPEATIRKMEIVARAALAPAEPSSSDIQVAQTAQQQKIQAQAELRKEKAEEQGIDKDSPKTIIEELLQEYTKNSGQEPSQSIIQLNA